MRGVGNILGGGYCAHPGGRRRKRNSDRTTVYSLGVCERFSIMYVQQDPSRKSSSETSMFKQGKANRAVVLIPTNYELCTAGNRFDIVHQMQRNKYKYNKKKRLKPHALIN